MSSFREVAIVSDLHYAGPQERARGNDYEYRDLDNQAIKQVLRLYRRFVWLHNPLEQWPLLERFLEAVGKVDYLVANGDYSCDSGFVGVSDAAAFESAQTCVSQLRRAFPERCACTFGDHELGKLSLLGARGGMRIASYYRACSELGLQALWRVNIGRYRLLGITSSLVALPLFLKDTMPVERTEWERLRQEHLVEIREAFGTLQAGEKVLLFCHDPSALPFLWEEPQVRLHVPQIEQTIIGHLHTNLILWQSRMLAGMPVLRRFGPSVVRMTTALREAKKWVPFKVRLCPALAGIELLKDGGYLTARLDEDASTPAKFTFHPIPR
jgi:hypothetical protein